MTPAFIAAVLDTLLPGEVSPPAGERALPPASRTGIDAAALAGAHPEAFPFIAEAAGGEAAFVAASPALRGRTLTEVEQGPHATAFKAMVADVLQDYYATESVLDAMGWRRGPPQPLGHRVPATDDATWQRLERVKQRDRLWR